MCTITTWYNLCSRKVKSPNSTPEVELGGVDPEELEFKEAVDDDDEDDDDDMDDREREENAGEFVDPPPWADEEEVVTPIPVAEAGGWIIPATVLTANVPRLIVTSMEDLPSLDVNAINRTCVVLAVEYKEEGRKGYWEGCEYMK